MTPKEYIFKDCYGKYYFRDPKKTVWHRERGLPAQKWINGAKEYCENGARHRLDGFAVDWRDYKDHHLNGKRLFTKTLQ